MSTSAATVAGFLVCAAAVAAGQAAIGAAAAPWAGPGLAQDLGHTFTGLTAALGYALWRWGRAGASSGIVGPGRWRDRLLQAAAASAPALFGWLYHGAAGPGAGLHARAFAALPPLVYLLAVAAGARVGGGAPDAPGAVPSAPDASGAGPSAPDAPGSPAGKAGAGRG